MEQKYVRYDHYGSNVWVREDLKGKHREHCLCWSCGKFKPLSRDDNCPKANILYAYCVNLEMTTPVWECVDFEEKDGG